jgi:glycosyltransferase involved in cell wall biosynthesis
MPTKIGRFGHNVGPFRRAASRPPYPLMRIAVVVTTYNRPSALRAVLEGLAAQQDHDFEVVIADDGSTAETQDVVRSCRAAIPTSVTHVWHEDLGFRAAAIRNRAVARTQADYIVFTDGDCIPPPHFVGAHRQLAEHGHFVAGNRLLLSETFTRRVLEQRLPIHAWTPAQWLSRVFAATSIDGCPCCDSLPMQRSGVPGQHAGKASRPAISGSGEQT